MFEGLAFLYWCFWRLSCFTCCAPSAWCRKAINYTVERFGKYVRTLQPGLA